MSDRRAERGGAMSTESAPDEVMFDPAAQVTEITALLREGGWDGDDVVAGVKGLITYSELLRLQLAEYVTGSVRLG